MFAAGIKRSKGTLVLHGMKNIAVILLASMNHSKAADEATGKK
jgi:hypothetical protein